MFTGASVAAIAGFVGAGRLSPQRLDTSDLAGWLDRSDPVDAFAEIARWLGLGLATYVAIVSFGALLAEIAATARMPRVHRWLHRLVGAVALPALRRRLLELATVATITASSLHALPAGATAAPASTSLVVDSSASVPMVALRGEFQGFGIPTNAAAEADPPDAHLVRRGETLSQIIAARYGRFDTQLLQDVLDANPQIGDPNLIVVGWTIALPDEEAFIEPPPVAADVRGEATWAVVTVGRGDTLWDIVDRHYGHATADLVWATVEANPGLSDPNLIFAGQLITLPPTAVGSPAALPTASAPTAPGAPDTTTVSTAPIVVVPAPAAPGATTPPTTPLVVVPVEPSESQVTEPSPSTATTSLAPPVAQPTVAVPVATSTASIVNINGSHVADEEVGPSLAQLIGWTGGAGLAAALLGLVVRRRRRLPLADRLQRPSKRAVDLGVALRETDNLSAVDWAARALRTVAGRLRPRPGEPTPVPRFLRLAGDQIELVWDTPCTDSPDPWLSPDGGWSWTLERSIERSAPDNPNPCPCLVTIGRHGGVDVLLNLESCGALAVTGDAEIVAAVMRSMSTELACSAFADTPTVLVVGAGRLPGEPEHARQCEASEAIGWLRDRSESAGALLAHRRLTSLFAIRARSRAQDGHEPVIIVIDPTAESADDVATLIGLANGDLGAVVVVAGAQPSIEWQLDFSADAVTIRPLGLVLEPAVLTSSLLSAISEIVPPPKPEEDEIDADEEVESPQLELVLADHFSRNQMMATTEDVGPESVADAEHDWDVELKVLGQVRSSGTKQPLTPTELHLAIYLAFHRNGENSDTIATMVWPKGAADRTITNAMASLRRKLGTGSDGEMLFPLGRDNQYVYRLSPRVITDWDRFVALARRADGQPAEEAIALLDQALELVDGPPFRAATGYSWAYSDGTATLIAETVKAIARRCVDIHNEREEPLEAAHAAASAARAVDVTEGDDYQSFDEIARRVGGDGPGRRML